MLLTLLVFLAILSLLVFVHELGHFLVAKKAGIGVKEFGFGLPPKIWGKRIGETTYSFNLLPIGGFVRLAGEDEEPRFALRASRGKQERMFWAKSKMARVAVVSAGVVMNFLLAVVAFSLVYTQTGIPIRTDRVVIVGILPASPAEQIGFQENDVVVTIGGEKVAGSQRFIDLTQKLAGREVELEIVRKGENKIFLVTPRANPPEGEGPLGIVISDVEMRFYPFYQMPFRGIAEGFKEAVGWASLMLGALGKMFWQLVTSGAVPKDVAGPVGIFQITGMVAKGGFWVVLQFLGILSVNLALVNILPFPALDGGRLLFVGIEAVTGRRVKAQVERWVHQIGMLILLFLILLVTYNDILRLLATTSLKTYLQRILPINF